MQEYSVIIPTHGRPAFLTRALESVFHQTILPQEVIVVDDASEEPVSLPSFVGACRVTVLRQERCIGGAAARNVGLLQTKSPIVAFLDDDDEWLPMKMARQLAYHWEHPEAVLVSCGHFRVEGGTEYSEVFREDFVKRYHQYDNFWGSFSFLTVNRTKLGGEVMLDPELPSLQDWEFALRITRGRAFGIIEEPLVRYHAHDLPRITTRRSNRVRGLRRCYIKHRKWFTEDARQWLLSRLIFERSRQLPEGRLKRRMVVSSVLLGFRSQLPLGVRLRSVMRRAATLFIGETTILRMRCGWISFWQRLRSFGKRPSPNLSVAAERPMKVERGDVSPQQGTDCRSRGTRVLMISGRADFGGGPEHVCTLAKEMAGYADLFIACPREEPYWERYARLVGEKRMLEIPHRSLSLAALRAVVRLVRRDEIEIIHAHGRAAGIYGRLAGVLARTPCIYTSHGGTPVETLKTFCYACVEWLLSLNTSRVIAVSENEAVGLRKLCARRGRLRVIPNGVEIPCDTVDILAAARTPLRITHVTRFVYQKNTELMVPILENLRERGALSRFKFVILGDGPGREPFAEALKTRGMEKHVEIMGAVSNPRDYFRCSYAVLSTSRWEGLPLALLEAMALGLPVIATDVVGNRDAVCDGETGFVYDQNAPENAAQHLVRMADDPALWRSLSAKSRARAVRLFSSAAMASATFALYQEVLGTGRRATRALRVVESPDTEPPSP